jgi:tetratricopeptide (TPR) repeat protein
MHSCLPSFHDDLILLLDNEGAKYRVSNVDRELGGHSNFIDELTKSYLDEIALYLSEDNGKGNIPKLVAKSEKVKSLEERSLSSQTNCNDLAEFLFFTDAFNNPLLYAWAANWLVRAAETYPNARILQFLYLGRQFSAPIGTDDKNVILYMDLRKGIIEDYSLFVDLLKRSISITYYAVKHVSLLNYLYDYYSKRIFPEVTKELFSDALASARHSVCAEYYRIAMLKDEAEKETLIAFRLYSDSCLALAQAAYLKAKEDGIEAEEMFLKAIGLSKTQFEMSPKDRLFVQALGYSGLGYIYNLRTIYHIAEKHYSTAIRILQDSEFKNPFTQYLEGSLFLNRGRNRLDSGDLSGAKKDLTCAIDIEPELAAAAKSNLGVVYYQLGLNEKSESEFIEAIEEKFALPHAYYNLGVMYSEDGKPERAKKLFQMALSIDRDFKEARIALKMLRDTGTNNIPDWYAWWFNSTSFSKKALGTFFIALLILGIGTILVESLLPDPSKTDKILNPILSVLGIVLIFLILPFISKLKIGSIIDLEMETKGERPLFYAGLSITPVD